MPASAIGSSPRFHKPLSQFLIEQGDSYFIPKSSTCWKTALKVASYCTIVIPLLVWIGLTTLRRIYGKNQQIQRPVNRVAPPIQQLQNPFVAPIVLPPNRIPDPRNIPHEIVPPPPLPIQDVQEIERAASIEEENNNAGNEIWEAAKRELEEGVHVSAETIEKIKSLVPLILNRTESPDIDWLSSGGNLVFCLPSVPDLVFKMHRLNSSIFTKHGQLMGNEIIENRFKNMILAQTICKANQLGLLLVPHAKQFEVSVNDDKYIVIAEQKLNLNAEQTYQERLYDQYSESLAATSKQLATFIAKTGFSDVEWRNMPIVDTDPKFPGNRRVGLIDLEEMEDSRIGIYGGGWGRRGLVGCLFSEEQIDAAIAEATLNGVKAKAGVKEDRMAEIALHRKIYAHYERNGILENERKPIEIADLNSLEINLDEMAEIREFAEADGTDDQPRYHNRPIALRELIGDIVEEINKQITKTDDDKSTKGKRYILLDPCDEHSLIRKYNRLPFPYDKIVFNKEEEERLWVNRILKALVEKGYIFSARNRGSSFLIQA